jgi:ABC-type Fe3+/spermidine/putrescine transport system ATPase subunit
MGVLTESESNHVTETSAVLAIGAAGGQGEPQLQLTGLTKRFGPNTAVDHISLEVRSGEMFALLGPSGCGKTTTLRMIAGLEPADQGSIRVAGRTVVDTASGVMLPPEKRNMGMVFQSYAIWPHMTVQQNVAFPLRLRRTGRKETRRLVEEILEVTGLTGLGDRPATRLSGGQQQRVALARALVYRPAVLLLDEPLSNLDTSLREQMRHELRRLQGDLGVTVVIVTHDQDEAMGLSDRMAVMNAGHVEQVGSPTELYESPASPFVRDFLGQSVLLDAVVRRDGAHVWADVLGEASTDRVALSDSVLKRFDTGDEVTIVIRPEDVSVVPVEGSTGPAQVTAQVVSSVYLGDRVEYHMRVGKRSFQLSAPRRQHYEAGSDVRLELDVESISVWPR